MRSGSDPDCRDPIALSPEEIEHFVERGYLLVRGCFPPEVAAELVRGTLVDRDPAPRLGHRRMEGEEPLDAGSLDLADASTWGRTRLDVETGRSLPIERFAPRLWSAIRTLIGPDRQIARWTMGESWVLNGFFAHAPAPPLDPRHYGLSAWHIDAPSPRTTLDGRYDALVLLILWSDVDPGGGGTLYSGASLGHVVRCLEAHPEGVDTTSYAWGTNIVLGCGDVRELTGRAGDVLITHPFTLHAGQHNYSQRVRVLENPIISVEEPMRYRSDHASPSPVERAVIRRLSRPRLRPRDWARDAARCLIERHPDYFLPGHARWSARVDAEERRLVNALDDLLVRSWVSRVAHRIEDEHDTPLRAAEVAIANVRLLVVNWRAVGGRAREPAAQEDLGRNGWSRLLRGFMSCRAQNHLLGLVLAELFDEVRSFDILDHANGRAIHTLLLVSTGAGWFFADAWASHPIFHLRSRFGPPHPGTLEYDELEDLASAVRRRALYSRERYEAGRPSTRPLRLPEAPTEDPLGPLRARSGSPARSFDPWQSYLAVRAEHLLEGGDGMGEAYGQLAAKHRFKGTTRSVIEALAERARLSQHHESAP